MLQASIACSCGALALVVTSLFNHLVRSRHQQDGGSSIPCLHFAAVMSQPGRWMAPASGYGADNGLSTDCGRARNRRGLVQEASEQASASVAPGWRSGAECSGMVGVQ